MVQNDFIELVLNRTEHVQTYFLLLLQKFWSEFVLRGLVQLLWISQNRVHRTRTNLLATTATSLEYKIRVLQIEKEFHLWRISLLATSSLFTRTVPSSGRRTNYTGRRIPTQNRGKHSSPTSTTFSSPTASGRTLALSGTFFLLQLPTSRRSTAAPYACFSRAARDSLSAGTLYALTAWISSSIKRLINCRCVQYATRCFIRMILWGASASTIQIN